ncbi:lysylphosphatidylglycerol synthase transmembrane domain-containing protein [Pseudonocardia acidicola]|uniref:Flippase-like domain-containing protein n=1 Tax=Pseudonocardia acidicola TaxID=2724939 RepID=A0ABX1SLM6_9PSEU|nr:YbhN family protein [Pseudonocardia acidicola]NMI01910.1 flippase-like domain-containing protein [Pseudonocardia acidicola]
MTTQAYRPRNLRMPGYDAIEMPDGAPSVDPGAAGAARRRAPRWRRVAGCLLALLLAVEVVLVAPSLNAAVQALSRPSLGWLTLAVLAAAASMSMFARVRRRLLRAAGVRTSLSGSVAAVYVANALHATLPGGAAFSTAYSYRWMRSRGASGPVATWNLVASGLVSTGTLVVVGLTGSLLAGGGRTSALHLILEVAGFLAAAVGARQLSRRPEWVLAAARWGLQRVNRILRRPAGSGAEALDDLVAQLRSVRPTGQDWASAGAFALLNWAFDLACLAACAAAVGVHGVTLPLLLVAYTAGMATSSLSLVPGGIGLVDAALVLTLVAGGIPAASALPAVVLYRLVSFVGVVAIGWVLYAVLRFTAGADVNDVAAAATTPRPAAYHPSSG